jgi:hypothetical protein
MPRSAAALAGATVGIISMGAGLVISGGAANDTTPRRARSQRNTEIRTADRPDQYR